MQQAFWDGVLLNCADCEEAACKQGRCGSIQSRFYSELYPQPLTRENTCTPSCSFAQKKHAMESNSLINIVVLDYNDL